jgi:hypothetical protein
MSEQNAPEPTPADVTPVTSDVPEVPDFPAPEQPTEVLEAAAAQVVEHTPVTADAPAPTYQVPPAPEVPQTPAVAPAAPVGDAGAPALDAGAPAQWPSAGYTAAAPATYPAAPGYPTQPGYAAPGYGYAPAPAAQTSNNAVVALILSVVSWVICPIIAAVVALIFANMAAKEIDASGGRIQGQGLVTASRWVAWINIGLFSAAIILSVFVALFFAIVLGSSANSG